MELKKQMHFILTMRRFILHHIDSSRVIPSLKTLCLSLKFWQVSSSTSMASFGSINEYKVDSCLERFIKMLRAVTTSSTCGSLRLQDRIRLYIITEAPCSAKATQHSLDNLVDISNSKENDDIEN
jgi:hypothetical protein